MTNPTDSLPDCLPECVAARDARNSMTQHEKNAEDFKQRRSGEGVFYATGLGETQVGVGESRRLVPVEYGLIREATQDFGDGKGTAWVETDPALRLSTGPCRGSRRLHRLGANSDWNVRAWGHMPLDWNEPRVNGAVLPIATNRIDPSLPASRWNPKGKTVARHFHVQWQYKITGAEKSLLFQHPTYWLDPVLAAAHNAKGARIGLHVNKLVFITGGQSSDQVAVNFQRLAGGIKTLFYNGNSTQGISPQLVTDLLVPDEWFTFELLMSDQIDPAANDDPVIKATTRGGLGYPRFVALWMARYGEPAQLVGYTNHDPKNQGPAMVPSRLTDDRPCVFKYQDANVDDTSVVPMIVVGEEHGLLDPSKRVFYAVRYLPAVKLKSKGGAADTLRYFTNKNSHFRTGTLPGWGNGHTIGFTSGALATTAYIPKRKDGAALTVSQLKQHQQFEIARTEYAGVQLAAPDGVVDYVHRIELAEDTPVVPRVGDCLVSIMSFPRTHGIERLPGYPEMAWYYDEPIFSAREIPFPHQQGVPLPKPWVE